VKKIKKPAMDTTGMYWDGFVWKPLALQLAAGAVHIQNAHVKR